MDREVGARPVPEPGAGAYVAGLWRRRYPILAFTIVCSVVALVLSLLSPPQYESTATLIVSSPASSRNRSADLSAMVESRAVAADTLAQLGPDASTLTLDPTSFLRETLDVRQVPQSDLLTATVRLGDPDLAARVANLVAELAVRRSQEVAAEAANETLASLERDLAADRERMETAGEALVAFQRESRIEVLRAETQSFVRRVGTLPDVLVDIAAEESRREETLAALENRQKILTLRRSLVDDPAMLEAMRESSSSSGFLGFELATETVDPAYTDLEQALAAVESRLAALHRQNRELSSGSKPRQHGLARLDELYAQEERLSELQLEHEVAQDAVRTLEQRRVQARAEATLDKATLQVLDPAIPPSDPVSPRPILTALLTALLASLLAGSLALILSHVELAARAHGF